MNLSSEIFSAKDFVIGDCVISYFWDTEDLGAFVIREFIPGGFCLRGTISRGILSNRDFDAGYFVIGDSDSIPFSIYHLFQFSETSFSQFIFIMYNIFLYSRDTFLNELLFPKYFICFYDIFSAVTILHIISFTTCGASIIFIICRSVVRLAISHAALCLRSTKTSCLSI